MNKKNEPSTVDFGLLAPQFEEFLKQRERKGSSGSGSDGEDGTMDWKQSVETRLGQLHSDMRLLGGGLIAIFLAIIGLYVWTGTQVNNVNEKFSPMNDKIHAVSEKVAVIDTRTQSIETTVTSINRNIDILDAKMDRVMLDGIRNDNTQRSTEQGQP